MKLTEEQKQQSKQAVKWIKALLSGKYKQGKEILGNAETGFCCWGLGCYITNKPYNPQGAWDFAFAETVGFKSREGQLKGTLLYEKDNLATVNDETSAGFKRIGKFLVKHADENFAPYIAKTIKRVFKLI